MKLYTEYTEKSLKNLSCEENLNPLELKSPYAKIAK